MDKDEKKQECMFREDDGSCGILDVKRCFGERTECSFRQTTEEFNMRRDAAITRCREKGLCSGCKYTKGVACRLSAEKKKCDE